MATKIIAPKLGLGTEPHTIVEWLAKEGGRVEKDAVISLVITLFLNSMLDPLLNDIPLLTDCSIILLYTL